MHIPPYEIVIVVFMAGINAVLFPEFLFSVSMKLFFSLFAGKMRNFDRILKIFRDSQSCNHH